MSKRLEKPDQEALENLRDAIARWHPELDKAGARVALIMVWPPTDAEGRPTGPALRHAGHAAAGRVSLAKPRERLLTGCDAVIEIDAEGWEGLLNEGRLALLDRELEHLVVVTNDQGVVRYADGHPKLKIRCDDWLISGFNSVVRRHGRASLEAASLRRVCESCQELFEFMQEQPAAKAAGKRKAG